MSHQCGQPVVNCYIFIRIIYISDACKIHINLQAVFSMHTQDGPAYTISIKVKAEKGKRLSKHIKGLDIFGHAWLRIILPASPCQCMWCVCVMCIACIIWCACFVCVL